MAATQGVGAAKAILLAALRKLNQELTQKVGDGRENFEAMKFDRLNEFLNFDCKVGIANVAPFLSYVQCLKAAGVKTRAELEHMWKGWYHDEKVRECVEELLSLEESIQELFDDIDVVLQKAEDQLPSRMSPRWVISYQPICLSLIAAQERWSNLRMFGSSPSLHFLMPSSFTSEIHVTSIWRT